MPVKKALLPLNKSSQTLNRTQRNHPLTISLPTQQAGFVDEHPGGAKILKRVGGKGEEDNPPPPSAIPFFPANLFAYMDTYVYPPSLTKLTRGDDIVRCIEAIP